MSRSGNHPADIVLPGRVVASGLGFPEGPVVLSDGSIAVVELARGRVSRIDPADGRISPVASTGGSPNGAALGPDGHLWICNNGGIAFDEIDGGFQVKGIAPDYAGGSIQRIDLADGSVETIHQSWEGRRLSGPNDLVFTPDGSCWFTDQPRKFENHRDWGAVFRFTADGVLSRPVGRLDDPNGIGVSPDGTHLYVSETSPGRVWSWGLAPAGGLLPLVAGPMAYLSSGAGLVGRTSRMHYFDSLAVTAAGKVVVATLGEPGGLSIIDPETGQLQFVTISGVPIETFVTNLCFAGPDMRTAYITLSNSGLLVEVEWPEPGLPLAF